MSDKDYLSTFVLLYPLSLFFLCVATSEIVHSDICALGRFAQSSRIFPEHILDSQGCSCSQLLLQKLVFKVKLLGLQREKKIPSSTSANSRSITKTRQFKYIENFQIKNSNIFSYICLKHRLWVFVSEYPQSMFF